MHITKISTIDTIPQSTQHKFNNYHKNPICLSFQARDSFIKNREKFSDIIEIFNKRPSNVPQGLELKVAPRTNTIFGFTKILENGNVLEVQKYGNERTNRGLFYVVFRETKKDRLVSMIGVDFQNHEILKLAKDGKAKFLKREYETLDQFSNEHAIIATKLDSYAKEIFGN